VNESTDATTSPDSAETDRFVDIRPYYDDEVRQVLERLVADPDFLGSIASFFFPRLTASLPGFSRWLAQRRLRSQVRSVHDIASMQAVISGYMDKMLEDTTDGLSSSGLDRLSPDRSYLFISNHRDIVMDPAVVNYLLYKNGHSTLQIAIGDNLLKRPFVTDLMRLNKSFVVKRSAKGRELLQALLLLSEYIHHCIGDGQNVWIAQREGRAKDGIDRTDPALLKMLAMSQRDLGLAKSLRRLHIVPVAISYEYDACDLLKAEELYQIETAGSFQKDDNSDINSIVTGMTGYKGRVHVAFGEELRMGTDDPEAIAAGIDEQIIANYQLWDSNYLAAQSLKRDGMLSLHRLRKGFADHPVSPESRAKFEQRLLSVPTPLRKHFLFGYANPVISRFHL
jgi:1-acyl-sn-glycerol-3-phosphate acyltransferase